MKHIYQLAHFLKPYGWLALAALALLTAQVFLDLSIPRLIQRIIDEGIQRNDLAVVSQTSLLMLGLSLTSMLVAVGNNVTSIRVGEGLARDLREAIFLKIQSFSYGDLDRFSTGRLMVRLSSDSGAVQRVAQISLRIGTRAPLMMIGSLILMLNTDFNLALVILPLLVVTTVVLVFFSLKMEPFFASVQQKLDRLNTVLQENIAGARLVKAFVRADFEGQRFDAANEEYTGHTVKVMMWMSSLSPLLTIFVNLGLVVVIYAGGLKTIEGGMSLGQLVAFTNYLLTTMTPLTMMAMFANTWANGIASAQRINEILDLEPEVQDRPDARTLPEPVTGRVVFENASFFYNGNGEAIVLDGVNLTVEPGQTVAILGATGAGKTSLVNLLPRFYDVTSGKITLDGIDLRDLRQESLLAQIAVVPQETILFSGTVRDNVCYGRPDASDEEVIEAAKAAQAHEFILKLPQGYASRVEERGLNLSGGQKQRLAIARAILARPKILILDDSTSSVDVETETYIQQALEKTLAGCTRFVVAQRISTVLKADQIVVIDRGKVAAQGTHRELMENSPIYQEIYESQLGNGLRLDEKTAPLEGAPA